MSSQGGNSKSSSVVRSSAAASAAAAAAAAVNLNQLLSKAAKRGSIHYIDSDPKYLRARLLKLQQKQQAFAHAAHTQLGTFGVVGVRKKAFVIDTTSMLSDHFEEIDEEDQLSNGDGGSTGGGGVRGGGDRSVVDLDMPSLSGISHAISSLVS